MKRCWPIVVGGFARTTALAALGALAMTLIPLGASVVTAAAMPLAAWAEPASGTTVSGVVTLKATATPVDYASIVTKWCLTRDGLPVTTNTAVYVSGFGDLDYAAFSPGTGCWMSSYYGLYGGAFSFDTTAWANGTHTYQLTVTDNSGRSSMSPVLSITNENFAPSVTWVEPASGTTVSGTVVLKAWAEPDSTGTAIVTKWCLTRDGLPVTTNTAVYVSGFSDVDYAAFSPGTGCWMSSYYGLYGGAFSFDTTAWANGTHTFQLTVTDNSDRTTVSSALSITNENFAPSVTWVEPAAGTTVSGTVVLKAWAEPDATGTAIVTKWCLTRDGSPATTNVAVYVSGFSDVDYATFSPGTGCWMSSYYGLSGGAFSFDTTAWANGTHTFQLTVTDNTGRTATSALALNVSNPIPGFSSISPVRLFDTRPDTAQGAVWVDKTRWVGPANTLRIPVAGVAGVPTSGVSAVSLNVTVVDPQGAGFITVYPCGARPLASNLNFVTWQVVPNAVIAPVSGNGEVCLYSNMETDLLADINGWFVNGSGFTSVSPVRLFDSRPTTGQGAVSISKQTYGGPYNVLRARVVGVGGLPASGVGAVSLNVTVTDGDAPGYVTVYPCGSPPLASNLNFLAGQVVPNAVITPVSANGEICLFSNTNAHLLADVNGWFAAGAGFSALSPARLFDTRLDTQQGAVWVDKTHWVGPGRILRIPVAGIAGVPVGGVSAVSLNVTVANPQAPGYITVYPCGSQPLASNLNFVSWQVVPNAVIAPVSAAGEVCFYSSTPTDLLADINGWFTS